MQETFIFNDEIERVLDDVPVGGVERVLDSFLDEQDILLAEHMAIAALKRGSRR